MSATEANIALKTGANSCGVSALRGMAGYGRGETSGQTIVGERVAVDGLHGNSLNARDFAEGGSSNPNADNDIQPSAGRAANLLSGKLLAVSDLRGFGPRTNHENATRITENLTRISTLMRWCKFNFVGAIGIFVQFGALFLLKSGLHFNYLAATAVAVEAAVVHNFFWHERFTWADRIRSGQVRPSWGGHPSGAKAQNLPMLFAALKRCATQKLRGASVRSLSLYIPKLCKLTSRCLSLRGASSCSLSLRRLSLRSPRFARFVSFNLTTGLVSIAGNLGMMRVMVGRLHMHYLLANGIAIGVCSLVNFVVSDEWVFGE